MRKLLAALCAVVVFLGLGWPDAAKADRDGSNWHRLTSYAMALPANGETYSDGVLTARAVPGAYTVVCVVRANPPQPMEVNGWPSIILTGGVNCTQGTPSGPPAVMLSVSLEISLRQYTPGTGFVTKAGTVLVYGGGFVNTWYAVPVATCVSSVTTLPPLMRQGIFAAMLPLFAPPDSQAKTSGSTVMYGCKPL